MKATKADGQRGAPSLRKKVDVERSLFQLFIELLGELNYRTLIVTSHIDVNQPNLDDQEAALFPKYRNTRLSQAYLKAHSSVALDHCPVADPLPSGFDLGL